MRCVGWKPAFTSNSTKIIVGWGFAPDPTGGVYSAPPDPLTEFRGPTSKGGGKGAPICVWHRAPRELNPALGKLGLMVVSERVRLWEDEPDVRQVRS